MPTSSGTGLTQNLLRVVADDMTVQTGSGRGVNYGLSGGEDLTVIITSPTGKLKYYEARFSVVLPSFITFSSTPTITSVRYFDLNGNETTGPVADYAASLH
jgi:hypothetical protein